MGIRDENAEATRAEILDVARATFAADGYHATTVGELARRAQVTTGALYHHFGSKKELFREVVHLVMTDLMNVAALGATEITDPLEALKRILHEVLDRSRTIDVRIAFIEAPTVLGLEGWREIEKAYATQTLKDVLTALIESGRIRRRPVDVLAAVLRGAINEAAMVVAEAPESDDVRREAGELLDALLDGLS